MDEKLYSIKESTLTDIGDALRRKHGETKMGTVIEEVVVPDVVVSKTPNATGFDSWEGDYGATNTETNTYDVVQIPNASKIKVKIAYQFYGYANDYVEIAGGNYPDYKSWKNAEDVQMCKTTFGSTSLTVKEFEFFNTDAVSFHLLVYSSGYPRNYLGYYAECTGYDADGNPLGGKTVQVEKEAEVPNTYSSAEVAQAIDDIKAGADLPEEAFNITGDCGYRFAQNGWNWFIENYGDRMTTKDISNAANMFYYDTELKSIPFDINFKDGGCSVNDMFNSCRAIESMPSIDFKQTSYQSCKQIFSSCVNLKEIGTIKNMYPSEMSSFFSFCQRLRTLPQFENLNLNRIYTYASCSMTSMFAYCYSLRSIPEDFLKQFYQPLCTGYYYSVCSGAFNDCYALDEVRGLNPQTGAITSNMFSSTFVSCYRLKNIIFAMQDNGAPYAVKWKAQTIDLSRNVGHATSTSMVKSILDYNSGITADKEVKDDATYAALKDDPDWFASNIAYSRYNHDSAVATINSLPDTSAYLATAGGTNTIKFTGAAGSKTDGGAINTLTAEEIAVATAKGWTVTFA